MKKEPIWADRLLNAVKTKFKKVKDPRTFTRSQKTTLVDCLMSCFGVFSLKWPSLLQYEIHTKDKILAENFSSLFKVKRLPSNQIIVN